MITNCYRLLPRCTHDRRSDNGARQMRGSTQLHQQSLSNCLRVRVGVGTWSNHRLCQRFNDVITHPPVNTQHTSITHSQTDYIHHKQMNRCYLLSVFTCMHQNFKSNINHTNWIQKNTVPALELSSKVSKVNVDLYSALLCCTSKALRYGPCVTRGSHSFTCHPHTNHTCLYSPAARHHRPLAGTNLYCLVNRGTQV